MADTLKEILLDSSRRPAVATDLETLVDEEVSDKGGVSGAVIKTGFAAVKKVKPGIIGSAVDSLLDEFVTSLEPFYADFKGQGGTSTTDFGSYLSGRGSEAADALLSVTDARAAKSSRESIKKVYEKLRPNGKKNVEEALPRLGKLIDKHAAAA